MALSIKHRAKGGSALTFPQQIPKRSNHWSVFTLSNCRHLKKIHQNISPITVQKPNDYANSGFSFKKTSSDTTKKLQTQTSITRTSSYKYSVIHLIHYPLYQSIISIAYVHPHADTSFTVYIHNCAVLLMIVLNTRIKDKLLKKKGDIWNSVQLLWQSNGFTIKETEL